MAFVADRSFRRGLGTGKSLSFVRPSKPSPMRKLILLVAIAIGGWTWLSQSQIRTTMIDDGGASEDIAAQRFSAVQRNPAESYRCDGRTHCSQMTSCAEATYFLQNCPGGQWTATMMGFLANNSGASDR